VGVPVGGQVCGDDAVAELARDLFQALVAGDPAVTIGA
jgi:hypothetical protein